MQHLKSLLLPAIALLAIASCNRTEKIEDETDSVPPTTEVATPQEILITDLAPLVNREWKLVDFFSETLPPDADISLKFLPDNRISGNASVNRFNGSLTLLDGKIEVGPFAATRRAGPPEAMERERAYLDALASAKSLITLGDDQLIIAVEGKDLPLRFEAIQPH